MVRHVLLGSVMSLTACMAAEPQPVWAAEDCEKVSGASGYLLYEAGQEIEKAAALTEPADQLAAEQAYQMAQDLSELAVNYARNYEIYCQPRREKID